VVDPALFRRRSRPAPRLQPRAGRPRSLDRGPGPGPVGSSVPGSCGRQSRRVTTA